MIYDEVPSAWRFVKDTSMLDSERPCGTCNNEEDFTVITDPAFLPPFVFRGPLGEFLIPQSFILEDDQGQQIDLSIYVGDIDSVATASYMYLVFPGLSFPTSTPLQTGVWQAQVSDGINTLYSEPLQICNSFEKCVKITWKHSCDLAGIPYSQFAAYENVIYMPETCMLSPEYETEREESENIQRQVDPIFMSQQRTMRMKFVGPDWIVKMFQAMQLHDTITIAYLINDAHPDGLYSTAAEKLTVLTSELESECRTELELKFLQDDSTISTACCVPESYTKCLESCVDVVGYKDDFIGMYVEGSYYLDAPDSGIIWYYAGGVFTDATAGCVYAFSLDLNQYVYYNGDLWFEMPGITSVTFDGIDLGTGDAIYTITGFSAPGTWVYLSYVDPADYDFLMPITAAELIAGYTFQVDAAITPLYVRIKAYGHGCAYAESSMVTVTP